MTSPNASYSITIRVNLDPDDRHAVGRVTTAIGRAGGAVTAVDFVETGWSHLVVDFSANATDSDHADSISRAVDAVDGADVHRVSDRTFLMHLHGKLAVEATVPLRTRDDLSMAYTPGVARITQALVDTPEDAHSLTTKGNSVAVVTDGTAVLGLGDVGPVAAMPVMEGKAALFKRFADIDAWPICLDSTDTDEIVRAVQMFAPGFGGINLEDISSPRCFAIEKRLKSLLDIPVCHDDQHGTAIVVLAALRNALRVVGKDLSNITVALVGVGAAGTAVTKLLMAEGVGDIILADREGILPVEPPTDDELQSWLAHNTNDDGRAGTVEDALEGADVFIGVSGPKPFPPTALARMQDDAIVFALANPEPEVDPRLALDHAAVVASGRSDFPNQINNVLAFPGVFRGALDARATEISEGMKVAAAHALASVVGDEELRPEYIIPSVFNSQVAPAVAEAVQRVAETGGEAHNPRRGVATRPLFRG